MGRGSVLVSAERGGGEVVVAFDHAALGGNRSRSRSPCARASTWSVSAVSRSSIDHRGETVPLFVQEDGIGKFHDPDDNYAGCGSSPAASTRHTRRCRWCCRRGARRSRSRPPAPARCSRCAPRTPARRGSRRGRARSICTCSSGERAARRARPHDRVDRPPGAPPLFAFAPWIDAIYGSANVRRIADALRAPTCRLGAIWTEDWRGGDDTAPRGYVLEEDWRVDRELYPDFEALAGDLHGRASRCSPITTRSSTIRPTSTPRRSRRLRDQDRDAASRTRSPASRSATRSCST